MYETFELLFDIFVPKRIVRGFESLESARIIRLMLNGLLTYSAVLFLWNGLQFLGRLRAPESRQQITMSPFWQIAAMTILTANLHLRMVIGG